MGIGEISKITFCIFIPKLKKKRIIGFVGYSVIKSILKVSDDDKAFQAVEKLLGFEKYKVKKEPETYDSIINDLFGGNT